MSEFALVRRISTLSFDDAVETRCLIEVMQTQNTLGINDRISDAGAAGAGVSVRNALITRLVMLVSREYSPPRTGDLHLAQAFHLLRDADTRAEALRDGEARFIAEAEARWALCLGDHRHPALRAFRDKHTAHRGDAEGRTPPAYNDLFGLAIATSEVAESLMKGVKLDRWSLAEAVDTYRASARAFWSPWARDIGVRRDGGA